MEPGLIGTDGIKLGFDLFKRGPGVGHNKIGTGPQFFHHLESSALGPPISSGGAVILFVDLTVSLPDKEPVIE